MRKETANILAVLDTYFQSGPDDVAKRIANDFRRRRIERNLTREAVAREAGIALGNIARFEQKGLISLSNLIRLASTVGCLGELSTIFAEPKYSTIDELTEIRKNSTKKRAYTKK